MALNSYNRITSLICGFIVIGSVIVANVIVDVHVISVQVAMLVMNDILRLPLYFSLNDGLHYGAVFTAHDMAKWLDRI